MKKLFTAGATACALAFTVLCAVSCASPGNTDDPSTDNPSTDNPTPDPPKPQPWPETGMESATYITNGKVQIGVDLNRGGAVFHFSEEATKRNLLNHADEGRFVQQSYYGDSDGSKWNGTSWNWNPVQGGSWQGKKATVTSTEITDSKITVTSTPMHWATGEDLTDCVMKEEITLSDYLARIHYSFKYSGSKSHKARHQEMPAVFCDYDLGTLVYYSGLRPWTNGALTRVTPKNLSDGASNQYASRTEEWSAYVDKNDWGIGVYTPGTAQITYYTFGHGPGGAAKSSCSYFAPIRTLAITKDLELTYDVYLTIGTVDEIRSRFTKLR